jgi:hypothetical protein
MSHTHTVTQYRFPQANNIKQHPLQYFCQNSTYQYVPRTYSGKIVPTRYLLWVKSTYYVCTSTYTFKFNSHFISGTITLAAITSLLPTLVRRFAGRILPILSLLDCQAAQARLATSKLPQPRVDLIDVAVTPAIPWINVLGVEFRILQHCNDLFQLTCSPPVGNIKYSMYWVGTWYEMVCTRYILVCTSCVLVCTSTLFVCTAIKPVCTCIPGHACTRQVQMV